MTAISYDCALCCGTGKVRGGCVQNARTGRYEVRAPRRCNVCCGTGRINVYRVAGRAGVTPQTVRNIGRGTASARSCRRFLRLLPAEWLS